MMIIQDDHIWWSYMIIINDHHHMWWSYMMLIYDDYQWSSSYMSSGIIWESSGSHLGEWRLKRHLEVRSHITCLTLEQNAKVPLKFKFHDGFVMVPLSLAAYLQQYLRAAASADPRYPARPLYQDRENPYS